METYQTVIEEIEKSTMLLLVKSFQIHIAEIEDTISESDDCIQDVCEDITRDILDQTICKLPIRLPSKTDYKAARFIAHPNYVTKQALFVDSKAEKGDKRTMTLQLSQTSMKIRQTRSGKKLCEQGEMPLYIESNDSRMLTTTIFVKYCYKEIEKRKLLSQMILAAVPNGFLQKVYNPNWEKSFWRCGRNAPSLDEKFRVRVSFKELADMAEWRVQKIPAQRIEIWEKHNDHSNT